MRSVGETVFTYVLVTATDLVREPIMVVNLMRDGECHTQIEVVLEKGNDDKAVPNVFRAKGGLERPVGRERDVGRGNGKVFVIDLCAPAC